MRMHVRVHPDEACHACMDACTRSIYKRVYASSMHASSMHAICMYTCNVCVYMQVCRYAIMHGARGCFGRRCACMRACVRWATSVLHRVLVQSYRSGAPQPKRRRRMADTSACSQSTPGRANADARAMPPAAANAAHNSHTHNCEQCTCTHGQAAGTSHGEHTGRARSRKGGRGRA